MAVCTRRVAPTLLDSPRLGIVLKHSINGLIEGDQQRHVAGDDLRQHTHGGADLSSSVLIGQQAGEDFFSD